MALPQYHEPLQIDAYACPQSIEAAVRALSDGAGTPVAGGTDLWVQKDHGKRRFGSRLVNIRRIPALKGIGEDGRRVHLGALATVTEIREAALLHKLAPVLAQAADRFANVQIRNVATIGGNIANGSPAADMVLPLLCLDAEVELASWRNDRIAVRRLPLIDFFTGPGQTRRMTSELITGVRFDRPNSDFHAAFHKSGPRPALEIARVALCLAGRRQGRRLVSARLACGAVAPIPVRCRRVEAVIEGGAISEGLIAQALDTLRQDIAPIDDVRGSAWYRRHLACTYLEQELRRVAQA